MWIIIAIIVIIILIAASSSGNATKKTDNNNAIRDNSVQFYIKSNDMKIVTVDFTSNSVIYNGTQIGTYSIDSDGYTVVNTRSGVKIRYRIGYSDFDFCTFINETKNSRLASYRTSVRGYELVGPALQVSDRCLSTKDDDILASYMGDRNGAVATFVCAYTEVFKGGEYSDYFNS